MNSKKDLKKYFKTWDTGYGRSKLSLFEEIFEKIIDEAIESASQNAKDNMADAFAAFVDGSEWKVLIGEGGASYISFELKGYSEILGYPGEFPVEIGLEPKHLAKAFRSGLRDHQDANGKIDDEETKANLAKHLDDWSSAIEKCRAILAKM